MHCVQNLDRREFLEQYWQRQPLLIKSALPNFRSPLSAEELAGLALEPEVDSRIVQQSAEGWLLERGPFGETAFDRSGSWTLLVQSVDHYLEKVASLWQAADFLPGWRRDDIMVSYATDGGSVGPHYDNYDVFLLQGQGQRRWQLGQWCDGDEALLAHDSLRILASFRHSADYLLQPGDILYLPPRLAHWGEAVGESLTYSLGFRAPSLNDMLSRWLDNQLEQLNPEHFYTDPPLPAQPRPGEISAPAAQHALHLLQAQLEKFGQDIHWLGELVTEPRFPLAPSEAGKSLSEAECVRMEPGAKLAWSESGSSLAVYANGSRLSAKRTFLPLLQALCRDRVIQRDQWRAYDDDTGIVELLTALAKMGCVYVE